jgi:hypothetical protein
MLINGVDPESLAQEFVYDGSGNVSQINVKVPDGEGGVDSYRQTFTYTGGKLTKISEWVKQ